MTIADGVIEDATGRLVLVTGGSVGIGRMLADGFARAGATVLICARNKVRCEETARAIEAEFGGRCLAVEADVATLDGAKRLAAAVEAEGGLLHTLVNNAGIVNVQTIDDYSEKGWDDTVDVNLKAPFFITQQLLPALRSAATAARPASIINIASVGGMIVGARENYAYSASKAGVIHLTHLLSKWLAGDNITVNAIAPGLFPSEIVTRELDPEAMKQYASEVPLGRFGDARGIAGLAQFLASSYGTYMTGSVIPIDGGYRF